MVHLLELQEVERDHVSCMSIRSSLWQKKLRTLSFLCSSNALQSIKRNASILQVPGMERGALSTSNTSNSPHHGPRGCTVGSQDLGFHQPLQVENRGNAVRHVASPNVLSAKVGEKHLDVASTRALRRTHVLLLSRRPMQPCRHPLWGTKLGHNHS